MAYFIFRNENCVGHTQLKGLKFLISLTLPRPILRDVLPSDFCTRLNISQTIQQEAREII